MKKQNFNDSFKTIEVNFDSFNKARQSSDDESFLDYKIGEKQNFVTSDRTLSSGQGFKRLELSYDSQPYVFEDFEQNIKAIYAEKWQTDSLKEAQDYIFYLLEDGKMHYRCLDFPDIDLALTHKFNTVPRICKIQENDSDTFVICPEDEAPILVSQNLERIIDAPAFIDVCYHFNRGFALTTSSKNAVIYTDDEDENPWENVKNKRIDIDSKMGKLLRLISFDDYVYIFSEYGITRISAYSLTSKFSVDYLYESSSMIFKDSIVVEGQQIIFLTQNGLCTFDGNSVKKVNLEIFKELSPLGLNKAVGFKEKYYLAASKNIKNAEYAANLIICYDVNTKEIDVISGVNVKDIVALVSRKNEKLMCLFSDNTKAIMELTSSPIYFDQTLLQSWQSFRSDFGYKNITKRVKEVLIKAKSPCKIIIDADGKIETLDLKTFGSLVRLKSSSYGKELSFKIESNEPDQKISDFYVKMVIEK